MNELTGLFLLSSIAKVNAQSQAIEIEFETVSSGDRFGRCGEEKVEKWVIMGHF
jgi:hypothetical protein